MLQKSRSGIKVSSDRLGEGVSDAVLTSVENMTFNNVDLAATFNDKDGAYFIINEVRGRGVTSSEVGLITVTGMDGAHLSTKRVPEASIEVDITLKGTSYGDLRKRLERLSAILYTEVVVPIQFDDEPDRTYYGIVGNIQDKIEISRIYKATITIIRPDPYKYGPELNIDFPSDSVIVENPGTAEAEPIIELTAKEKTTFALVATGEEDVYNMIGQPADDDVQVVDTKVSVLYENGSTIDTWQTASYDMVDDYFIKNIDGQMGTDGAGIRADGYGTGDKLHGPAVFKELTVPIQDFEIETTFDIISRREEENFRMGVLFIDENVNILGHIGIKDNSKTYKRRVPLARYGPYRGAGRQNGNLIGDTKKIDNARETTLFYLRARREGDMFDFYIGEWQSHKHIRSWHETYHDRANEYGGRLKYITLYIATWADRRTPSRLRINSVEVFEITQVTEDHTPYIIFPGDKIVFDHASDEILLNGENAMVHKDFGGRFFRLARGYNTLTVMPDDAFDVQLRFRPRYR